MRVFVVLASLCLTASASDLIFGSCTASMLQACAQTTPPRCAVGQAPKVNPSCCISCVPPTPKSCSDCLFLNSLDTCEPGEQPKFEKETCCPSCMPSAMNASDIKPVKGVCGIEKMRKCLERISSCEFDEHATVSAERCCPTCRPAELACDPVGRVDCRRVSRKCEDDEAPVPLNGSCCASCVPEPQECDDECGDDQKCVPGTNFSAPSQCRFPGPLVTFLLRNGTSSVPHCDDMVPLLQAIVSRFCYRTENLAL
jgi:hypothetical protein